MTRVSSSSNSVCPSKALETFDLISSFAVRKRGPFGGHGGDRDGMRVREGGAASENFVVLQTLGGQVV
jgi:hypothetical protein